MKNNILQLGLHSEFKISLNGTVKPCLKKPQNKKRIVSLRQEQEIKKDLIRVTRYEWKTLEIKILIKQKNRTDSAELMYELGEQKATDE